MRSSDLLMHCALKSTVGAEPASIAPQSIVAQVKVSLYITCEDYAHSK